MNKTIFFVAAAAALLAGPAAAAEMKPVSPSVVDIGALPEDSFVSASIVAYGKPPEHKAEEKRRFEVGFVPTVPPPPNAEKTVEKAASTVEADGKPVEAAMEGSAPADVARDEKTASVESTDTESVEEGVNYENMNLRTE